MSFLLALVCYIWLFIFFSLLILHVITLRKQSIYLILFFFWAEEFVLVVRGKNGEPPTKLMLYKHEELS